MNRFGKLTFSAALFAAASACNQAPDGEQGGAANAQVVSNEAQITNGALQDSGELPAPREPEANSSAAAPPVRNVASESRPETRETAPKATRPAPAPDPHAGHDMSNMSNMSH